jgi:N-acyl-D-amino-acid deacylase
MMRLDLAIRGGTVIDGSGMPRYRADIGIANGRIVAVGRVPDSAAQEIDATGTFVTPGFIDGHTHFDAQILWDPSGSSSCWHGVTTAVMGNCGFTLAPGSAENRESVLRNLEYAEDIPREALEAGITDWRWDTFRSWLDVVDGLPKSINYASQIGHSALRSWAMGERALEEHATDDDMKEMKRELADAIEAGAYGFTTSRSHLHRTNDGLPVASHVAPWSEVRELVGVLGDLGAGVFEIAQDIRGLAKTNPDRQEAFSRLQALAVETGVPTSFGLVSRGDGTHQDLLDLLDSTAAAGGRMFGQSHCRTAFTLLSFKTRLPYDDLPRWKPIRSLPFDQQIAALRDEGVRAALVDEARGVLTNSKQVLADLPPNTDPAVFFDIANFGVMAPGIPSAATLRSIADERGVEPVEALIDLALETDLNMFLVRQAVNFDEKDILTILKHPRTIMTFTDSGAHVGMLVDASLHTHLLAYWVRERQVFTLEEAVRMITLAPAMAWGVVDRGLIRPGMAADLNVLDLDRLQPGMPEVVHDLPAGGRRLIQKTEGIHATIVGGQVTVRDGQLTGALSGTLLRGPLALNGR